MNGAEPQPLFSVIIPTYNRALKVIRAIESVLSQTFTDFDIWVIDDGSTDQTGQQLEPYLNRIHYLFQKNGGAANARNLGIQQSSGKYVAFLDSDDRWYPQKLASIAAAICTQPETGLFYSQCDVANGADKKLWVDKSRAVYQNAYRSLLMGDFITASSTVVRRTCLEHVGKFDPARVPCEDWDLWLRIAREYPIYLVPKILVRFEYSNPDKLTANIQRWLNAHDQVIEGVFNRDPTLQQDFRQTIRANIAYVKGRICLEANADREALDWFNQALSLKPTLLKAQIYRTLLTMPKLRRFLPQPVLRRLRFPVR
jgi:glycosyltransferase involved in cell wall biosynthesis